MIMFRADPLGKTPDCFFALLSPSNATSVNDAARAASLFPRGEAQTFALVLAAASSLLVTRKPCNALMLFFLHGWIPAHVRREIT